VTSSLHSLLADGTVRYSQVWEDHALVEEGLAVGPDDDVLSIASAGCNALALLLREPRSVLAIDLNPAQVALVELKLRAIEVLAWEDLVGFLGVRAHDHRLDLYARIRPRLPERARAYWDAQEGALSGGVLASGRLEAFFRGFHAEVLPKVHPPEAIERLLAMTDPDAQARLFERELGSPAMRSAFTSYFTRERLANEGRDPRQMLYVEAMDVAGFFWERFRWVLTSLPARSNFYVHSFLTGRYRDASAVPPYLLCENHARLRALLPRIAVELADVEGALSDRPAGAFSKASFSDLFEYLSDEATDALFETIGARLRPRGRACFWNLLVPREPGEVARARLRPLRALADALYARDRSWFYRAFHVEEVSR
jgi:S-adenosylmethionine-diacylglycerol 3-amino-3-carboxypropyl transferase